MYKLVVLAVVLATAQAGLLAAPYAGLPLAAAPLGYAGLPLAAPLGYAGLPLAAAPLAHHAHAYALPAVREVQEAPIIQQAVEPVEQHGYKIRY
jgi:hypothetical protein